MIDGVSVKLGVGVSVNDGVGVNDGVLDGVRVGVTDGDCRHTYVSLSCKHSPFVIMVTSKLVSYQGIILEQISTLC